MMGCRMAQKVAFLAWFIRTTRAAKADYLSVPPSVLSIPCGCVRKEGEPAFEIAWRREISGWIHRDVGCMKQLDVPQTPAPKPAHAKPAPSVSRRVMGCWGGLS